MSEENRALIKRNAVSVWLNVELDVLWSRVQDKPGRPLLDNAAPYETLAELYKARVPIYRLADVTVPSRNTDNQEDVAKNIVRALWFFDQAHPDRATFERSSQDG